ncbi:MAG: hypothetical protein F4138_02135 [Acidimicrobiia bacterium]|nr:hypothetical protein [Acidimicrobiia bacterium]
MGSSPISSTMNNTMNQTKTITKQILQEIFKRRDLGVIDSLIAAGMIATGVFMWVEGGTTFDPYIELQDNWKWQLWQIGTIVLATAGVWFLWRNTTKVPWVRTVCLVSLAMAVLLNAYTDLFNQSNNLWWTLDPLFVACASVAVLNSRSRVMAQHQGIEPANPLTSAAGIIALGIGITMVVNGYIVGNAGAWDILNPLMILTLLTWASAARRSNVGDAI